MQVPIVSMSVRGGAGGLSLTGVYFRVLTYSHGFRGALFPYGVSRSIASNGRRVIYNP